MLEAQCHERSCFVTFTYEKEPDDGQVSKSDLSSTIHRLRASVRRSGDSVRFFGVGEFGDLTKRPHYHAALFGVGEQDVESITRSWHGLRAADSRVPGFVHVGALTPDSAAYITGYVTSKLAARLGREKGKPAPEFMVCSRRPGIGVLGIQSLIEGLNTNAGALYMARFKDVPVAFMIDGKMMPLGGHIRRQLRLFFFGEESQPRAAKELRERKFYEENMPFVPPDASPTLRKIIAAHARIEVAASNHAHFEKLKQQGRNRAAKHRIKLSMRTL